MLTLKIWALEAEMATQTGYKASELGIIPQEWKIRRIGDFTDCTAGGTPSTQVSSYWGGEIPWMSSGELHLKQVYNVAGRITQKGFENSSTKFVPANSVLIGLAGQGKTRGTVAISKIPLCTNQSIAAIFPTDEFNSTFLFYNLENRYDELRALSTGDGGRGGLNLTIIRNVSVKFPPLPEQTAIATALSDTDALISSLQTLIAKKKAIKLSAMQNLLSGKIRLPEFAQRPNGSSKTTRQTELGCVPEDWEVVELGNVVNIFDNLRIPVTASKRISGSTPYYGANGIQDYVEGFTHKGEFVLIAEDGANDLINYPVDYVNGEIWVNNHAHVVQGKENVLDNRFLAYRLSSTNITSYLVGGTRAKLNGSTLKIIQIIIPKSTDEQTAIAQLLSDMDAEIEALEGRLKKTRSLKQGMMQALLSGKIRLPLK